MAAEFINTIVPQEFPSINTEVFSTKAGTLYLKSPGISLIAAPAVNLSGFKSFLDGFPRDYKFDKYLEDPVKISSVDQLIKVAGQVCYASYGVKRSYNEKVQEYVDNLVESGHGSVLEHPNYSFLLYGISRSNSHEIVRHRAGAAYSQLSQRFVSGRVLRFVERPEYQDDAWLHSDFEDTIDFLAKKYENRAKYLLEKQKQGSKILSADQLTDLRKKVQQAARSVLPNETETVMLMTGNIRAWRHMISTRASKHGEVEIRKTFFGIYTIFKKVAPTEFHDFREIQLTDGTMAVETNYPKV